MRQYAIELNGVYVKIYTSRKRAFYVAHEYAKNPDNTVRIWHDKEVIYENHSN